ncbi:hypothetical protein BV20DRAFT_969419 [Pilatotrama ljubarskyi]|nr:hypothetical protein BV20DRAFT_969419 [Pilatotrama ljubarskyi]
MPEEGMLTEQLEMGCNGQPEHTPRSHGSPEYHEADPPWKSHWLKPPAESTADKDELPDVHYREDGQWRENDYWFDVDDNFWVRYTPFLAARGYQVCACDCVAHVSPGGESCPDILPFYQEIQPLPFPTRLWLSEKKDSKSCGKPLQGAVRFGRDARGRHIVLKVVIQGSPEYRIFERLLHCPELYRPESFPCVIPPLGMMNSPHKFTFVSMPMWSSSSVEPHVFDTVGEFITYLECMLKGLAFLHEKRIIHADIAERNIAVNCCIPELESWNLGKAREPYLRLHRLGYPGVPNAQPVPVLYALLDFNVSTCLPIDTSIRDCRRPAVEFSRGTIFHSGDCAMGEYDYNPFWADVGSLGAMCLYWIPDIAAAIPVLAPLLAKMVSHIPSARFTAAEALTYVTECKASFSVDDLAKPLPDKRRTFFYHDWWDKLNPDDRQRWELYAVPPRSWAFRVCDRIFSRVPHLFSVVVYLRNILRI